MASNKFFRINLHQKLKILVTGAAGFIGFHLSYYLAQKGYDVTGLDSLNDYYDVNLKVSRLKELGIHTSMEYNCIIQSETIKKFQFVQLNLEDTENLETLFLDFRYDIVYNLAAQAGVRFSLDSPRSYIGSNIVGFLNLLESCRKHPVQHLIYASSSSVYGMNQRQPYSVKHQVDHPISLYAATKKSNELMAHTYSHLFGVPCTGLRFFTVYGPWGRPDMAYFKFTKSILEGAPIEVYNFGNNERDFTYIDDIVEGLFRLLDYTPTPSESYDECDPSTSFAPFRIFNIGNQKPVKTMDFINILEKTLEKKAVIQYLPAQAGDVVSTFADVSDLERHIGFAPKTELKTGLHSFVTWFKEFYQK